MKIKSSTYMAKMNEMLELHGLPCMQLDGDARLDEDCLPVAIYEMANMSKTDSGLPVNVWIDTAQWYKHSSHPNSPRIKPQNNYNGDFQANDLFVITIPVNPENEPEVKPKNIRLKIKKSDVNALKRFVKEYRQELLELADKKITYYGFLQAYRKKEGME